MFKPAARPGAARRVTALVITIILAPGIGILPRLGFTVAPFLAAASILPLIGRNPLRAPLATWGMVVAHFGIAVALAGMAANAAFTSERLAVARPGETLSVGPWLVQLNGVTPTAGKNWTAIEAELRASRGNGRRHPQAADALFLRPADRDQRGGDRDLLERPALHRGRQARSVGRLAAALVVEAVRHPDLGRRRADRTRRRAGAARAVVAAAQRRGAAAEWRKERYA